MLSTENNYEEEGERHKLLLGGRDDRSKAREDLARQRGDGGYRVWAHGPRGGLPGFRSSYPPGHAP